jgi:hypothetical protein
VAIVGIGNELNGDDGAGVWVLRNLKDVIGRVADSPVLIIDAGTAPENVTGALRKFAPELILLIDAAQLNEPPGTARLPDGRPVSLRDRYVDMLSDETLLSLNSLWKWPTAGKGFGLLERIAVQDAEAVIIYIEEQYGPDGVVRFLNALGPAHSLAEAISAALPVSFGEFNRQWTKWIAGE